MREERRKKRRKEGRGDSRQARSREIERRKARIKDAGCRRRNDRENYSSFVAIAINLLLKIQ